MNDKESLEERGAKVGVFTFTSCLYSTITVHAITKCRKDPKNPQLHRPRRKNPDTYMKFDGTTIRELPTPNVKVGSADAHGKAQLPSDCWYDPLT